MSDRLIFDYKVKDSQGAVKVGKAAAATSSAVRKLLQGKGYSIISVIPRRSVWSKFQDRKISARDRSVVYRELSTMLKSGVGITQAVDIASDTSNKRLGLVMKDIYTGLENGFPLSVAMAGHAKVFPEVEVGVVRAGEATGNLFKVLAELAISTYRTSEFNSRVKGALIYPVFILIVMVIVGSIIITKVIPPIKDIFISSGATLPLTTRILLAMTDSLINHWPLYIATIAILAVAIRLFFGTGAGRNFGSTMALNAPVFGGLNRQVYLARFNRTLSLLVGAGVPIIQAVEIIAESTTNLIFRRSMFDLRRSLEQGAAVSSSLKNNKYFPRLMSQLLFVGQQSGDLGGSASVLADYYETEVDAKLRTLSTLLEPMIILVMGVAIAFVIVSVLQPIYSLTSSIQ